ncbi:hypothetical protein PBRA_002744 [Plasmodiophora brassicae]|uniref:FYVE-type domain-containing protein n=1 Tax=Plasmodiophora brassicae TaxID=37360 RepID=A0A0G4J5I8_PLABS|nr:hypothetical protein PBRA_002744 [Plasmodiophora brassicae]
MSETASIATHAGPAATSLIVTMTSDWTSRDVRRRVRLTEWVNAQLSLNIDPDKLIGELQNGVVLYQLVRAVDPNADVVDISYSAPPGSIRARENVDALLEYLRREMETVRTFEADDLLNGRAPAAVLDCLEDLIVIGHQERGLLAYQPVDDAAAARYTPKELALARASISQARGPSVSHSALVGVSGTPVEPVPVLGRLFPIMDDSGDDDDAGSSRLDESVTSSASMTSAAPPRQSLARKTILNLQATASRLVRSSIVSLPRSSDYNAKRPERGLLHVLRQLHHMLLTLDAGGKLLEATEMVMQNNGRFRDQIEGLDRGDRLPITRIDIVIHFKGEVPHEDSELVYHEGAPADLNATCPDRQLYLAVSRQPDEAPITDVALQVADLDTPPPPGFQKIIRSVSGLPASLNFGSGGKPVYLCYRQGGSAPITSITLAPDCPAGYRPVKRTTTGSWANLSSNFDDDGSDDRIPVGRRFLHYESRPRDVLARFTQADQEPGDLGELSPDDVQDLYFRQAAALLSACVMTPNSVLTHASLQSMLRIGCSTSVPLTPLTMTGPSINIMLQTLLDLCPSLLSGHGEGRQLHRLALKTARQLYQENVRSIDARTAIHFLQTTMTYSTDDVELGLCDSVIDRLVESSPVRNACTCSPVADTGRCKQRCRRCQSTAGLGRNVRRWIRESVLADIVETVVMVKEAENDVVTLHEFDAVDERCRDHICAMLSRLRAFPRNEEAQLLAITIAICKQVSEPPASYTSEDCSRPEDGRLLDHLLRILDKADVFLRASPHCIFLLRRVLVPNLIECCITGFYRRGEFQRVLKCFIHMYKHYARELNVELGAWIDSVLLELLDHRSCSSLQRTDILEAFEIVLNSAPQLMDLYANYDAAGDQVFIYERFISILAKLAAPSQGTLAPDAGLLQQAALDMMVRLLETQSRWLASKSLVDDQSQPSRMRPNPPASVSPSASPPLSPSSPTKSSADTPKSLKALHDSVSMKRDLSPRKSIRKTTLTIPSPSESRRRSSWRERVEKGNADVGAAYKKALTIASTKSLKDAVRFLVLSENARRQQGKRPGKGIHWRPIAVFLYKSSSLSQADVGLLLSSDGDEVFERDDMRDLRRAYMDMLDFTSRSFTASLRTFLSDSGFWIPDDVAARDRLIEAFAEAFCRDNRGAFGTVQSAILFANKAIELSQNTHDRCEALPDRAAWIAARISDGVPESQAADLFDQIASEPLNVRADRLSARKFEASQVANALLMHSETAVHNALAAYFRRRFTQSDTPSIMLAMFKATWVQFLGCFAAHVEANIRNKSSQSFSVATGLMHGVILSTLLSLPEETQSFLSILARVSYIYTTKDSADKQKLVLLSGDYMSQEWVVKHAASCKTSVKAACEQLVDVIQTIKANMTQSSMMEALNQVQLTLSAPIALHQSGRQLVMTGEFLRLCQGGRAALLHRVHLFNDVILYGSIEKSSTIIKKPRVIHLILCRAEPVEVTSGMLSRLRSSNASALQLALQITNVKKTLILFCKSEQERSRWAKTITELAPVAVHKHTARQEAVKAKTGRTHSSALPDTCALCLKYFNVFNRKHVCVMCDQAVDSACQSRRVVLPKLNKDGKLIEMSSVKVCDACYTAGRKVSISQCDPTEESQDD